MKSLEMPNIQIQPEHWQELKNILKTLVPNYKVWAFGSRANFTAKPFSDLDLALIGEQPLSLEKLAALTTAFSESNLPWKVDVLDWASTSEDFKKIIAANKVELEV